MYSKKILLIDDDEDEYNFFSEAIEAAGIKYDCMYANDPLQGIRSLDNLVPDYIFVDFNMPAMNGLECLKEIKKRISVKQTPVILYSTAINNELTNKAIQLGALTCVKKSFSIQELTEKLKIILSSSKNNID